ncbi:MAG: hypothetical protein M3Q23_04355 [Actinomycetota bacterium]|nr:hypothetical protein [Actinomycetota bacterium]
MFPTPKKTIAGLTESLRGRLSEPIQALGMFMPRSALTPGQSGRDVKHLMKQPVAVAVTPTRLQVFAFKVGAYSGSVKVLDELASWPRAGVRVVRGQDVHTLRGVDFNIGVTQNLIGLQFPDGHSVLFGYTPLGGTIRELEDSFVRELAKDAPQRDAPAGPAFSS